MDENIEPWDKDLSNDLISAIKHLRESFDEVHWGCGWTTRAFCYALLHNEAADDPRKECLNYLTQIKVWVGSAASQRFNDLIEEGTPSAIFKGFYDLYLESMCIQSLIIFKELAKIGHANEKRLGVPHLEWAEAQTNHLIRSHTHVIRNWVRDVCDKRVYDPNEDTEELIFWRKWQAPTLVVMEPSQYRPYDAATAWERNDAETSSRWLDLFAASYVLRLEAKLRKVVGGAALQLAKQPKPAQNSTVDTGSQRKDFLLMPRAERRDTPINAPAQSMGSGTAVTQKPQSLSGKADRRAAIDSYIEEVFKRTGKAISRADIWKAARYRTRSEFERWQRCDSKATKTAHERFVRILTEKPHLK